LKVNKETLEMLAGSAAEFLIHAVDVEGKQAGIDGDLLRLLAASSPIECVYAGGIRTLEDVEQIEKEGAGKVHYTIGSALDLFGGPLPYQAVVEHNRKGH
jgi:phosphoribosylformimino-5-aminoimidazole carboxamide ribotide isomerase